MSGEGNERQQWNWADDEYISVTDKEEHFSTANLNLHVVESHCLIDNGKCHRWPWLTEQRQSIEPLVLIQAIRGDSYLL